MEKYTKPMLNAMHLTVNERIAACAVKAPIETEIEGPDNEPVGSIPPEFFGDS